MLRHPDMALLFFVSGLAFFMLGLASALEWRRSSSTALAKGLGFLAAFGLLYAASQWLDMALLVRTEGTTPTAHPIWRALRVLLVAGAALALAQFGAELFGTRFRRANWLRWLPLSLFGAWMLILLIPAASPVAAQSQPSGDCIGCHWSSTGAYTLVTREWATWADIWARYLLILPGSGLAAVALLGQAPSLRSMQMPQIARFAGLAALGFAINALLVGLVVPPAPFKPASLLNYATFTDTFQVAPQLVAAAVALATAYFVLRVLGVFKIEQERALELARDRQRLAVFEERDRLAREFHDSVAQSLGFLGLEASTAANLLQEGRTDEARGELELMVKAADEAYADVREAILELRTRTTADRDFVSTVGEFVRQFGIQNGIRSELLLNNGRRTGLPPQTEVQLLRVIQEALTNVRKHAKASHVWVRLQKEPAALRVVVEDDGVGFEPSQAAVDGGHFGLQTMSERIEGVGGQLNVDSTPGSGTRVTLTLPNGSGGGR